MVNLSITLGNNKQGSIKLNRVDKNFMSNLRKGFDRAGAILERGIKKRAPVKTGTLRRSVNFQIDSDGMTLRVGPNVVYAAIHEFGGWAGRGRKTYIPARPYVKPTWEAEGSKVLNEIKKAIFTEAMR